MVAPTHKHATVFDGQMKDVQSIGLQSGAMDRLRHRILPQSAPYVGQPWRTALEDYTMAAIIQSFSQFCP
jgi:hypothetical protein